MRALLILLVATTALASARAEPGVRVDWQRGVVIAGAAVVGDLRAPNAELAGTAARRRARELARERLREAAKGLPMAGKQRLDEVEGWQRGLDRAVDEAIVIDERLGSDGSATVEVALGLEAVRTVLAGPHRGPRTGSVIVDARAIALRPALGYVVRDRTGAVVTGPQLFFHRRAAAETDPRMIDATFVEARSQGDGVVIIDATLAELPSPVLAFVVGRRGAHH